MNENLVCWIVFFVLGFWKILEPRVRRCCKVAAKNEGEVPCWFYFLRSEVWLTLGFVLLQARSLYDFYRFEMISYKMLDSPQIAANLLSIPDHTDEELQGLEIPPILKKVTLYSPIAGTVAAVLALAQAACVLTRMRNYRKSLDIDTLKEPFLSSNDDLAAATQAVQAKKLSLSYTTAVVISVLFTPVCFIVMSTRSTIRVLSILTGSAWGAYTHANDPPFERSEYAQVKLDEEGLYTMDLELGCAFQYVAVFAFANLCKHFIGLTGSDEDDSGNGWSLTKGFKCAGIQGIYAYVLLGCLRCLGNFGISVAQSFMSQQVTPEQLDNLENGVLLKVNSMFTFATILCIYNMFILSKLQKINARIPRASIKFLGTRGLLLLAQLQPVILKFFQSNSAVLVFLKGSEMFQNNEFIQTLSLSATQAELWHVTLLGYECLLLVLFNCLMWGTKGGVVFS